MSRRYYSSSAADTTLSSSITAGAGSITVAATVGFPVQYPYTLILDPETASEEVVTVTAGTGNTLTVTRGQDGTTALSHTTGAKVRHGVSARDFDEPNSHVNSSTGVHGLAGAVVGTTDAQTMTNKNLTDGTNQVLPAGVIMQYGGAAAPAGWLLADGAAISRTTYAALFAAIGTTHGAGDGSTTFNVPDLRDRVPVGKSATKVLGSVGGAETHAITVAEMPGHTHTANHTHTGTTTSDGIHNHQIPTSLTGVANGIDKNVQNEFNSPGVNNTGDSGTHGHTLAVNTASVTTSSTGSGTAMSLMQPYVALNHIIKV